MPEENAQNNWWEVDAGSPEIEVEAGTPTPEGGEDAWWEADAQAEPVPANAMGDVPMGAQQFSAGISEGAASMAGLMKGASLGMKVPVAHPWAKGGATVLGGLAGLMGGSAIAEEALGFFGVDRPEDLPEDQRALAFGLRSLGGALPMIGTPLVAGAQGLLLKNEGVGKLVNQIIGTAKKRPIAFTGMELSGAGFAATGASLAEHYFPGETGTRIGAEMLGGVLAPGNLAVGAYRSTSKWVRKLVSNLSPGARETQAGRQLMEMLDMTDEDPMALVEMLKADGVLAPDGSLIEDGLTSAQKTGSSALSALQKFLVDNNPDFKAVVATKEREALDGLRGLAAVLSKTGDPQALQTAAEAKSQYVRSLLQTLVDNQTQKAMLDASQIADDSPEAIATLSSNARDALDTTISEVRKAERAMWDAVPTDVPIGQDALRDTITGLRANLVPGQTDKDILPEIMRNFLKATEETGTATSQQMKNLRSELLEMGRSATHRGDFKEARILSDLANSVLDDMDQTFAQLGDEAYNQARTFSREMNEVFTRSFVGKATAQGKYGDRVAPELLLRKGWASGKEAADMHFQQLEDATNFLAARQMGDDVSQEAAGLMMDAQDRFTRLMFNQAVDPTTGLVNVKRLGQMMKDNESLLNRFPEIKDQLTQAMTSEVARKGVEDFVNGRIRHMEQLKTFEKIVGKDPVTTARQALDSVDIERSIQDMINVTRGGSIADFDSQEALKGVSASIFEAALRKSQDAGRHTNLEKFRAIIGKPAVPGGKAPLDVLLAKGAIDEQHHKALKDTFKLLDKIESARTPTHAVTLGKDTGNVALEFLSRVAGTRMAGKAGASSIQAHQASANLANHIAKKLTSVRMDEIFMRALNDREFMITLLQKAKTPAQAEQQARQLNAWLLQATSDLTELGDEEE